jgi:hypothetical protein
MDPTIQINERVDIVAVFSHRSGSNAFCVPKKMRWRGQDISLTDLSLRHPTVAGKRMIHVFHVSDGANNYRLEFDAEQLKWQLVAMMPELTPVSQEASSKDA